jgi:acetyltransferase EpsM
MRSLCVPKARWATVVHPTACIARSVVIGSGSFVASFVTIQPGAKIGWCVSIRAGANIGHDACVEDFVYIGPNASVCGNAILREGAHLAPNAVLLDRRTVGRFSVVGIGAAVMKNVEDHTVVIGNPARQLSLVCRKADYR